MTVLEIQVTDIREDITEIDEDVTAVAENVDFLFDEQVIQDERLLGLENRVLDVENNVDGRNPLLFIFCSHFQLLFFFLLDDSRITNDLINTINIFIFLRIGRHHSSTRF